MVKRTKNSGAGKPTTIRLKGINKENKHHQKDRYNKIQTNKQIKISKNAR